MEDSINRSRMYIINNFYLKLVIFLSNIQNYFRKKVQYYKKGWQCNKKAKNKPKEWQFFKCFKRTEFTKQATTRRNSFIWKREKQNFEREDNFKKRIVRIGWEMIKEINILSFFHKNNALFWQ